MTHPGLSTHVGVVESAAARADSLVVRQLGMMNLMDSTPIDKLFDDASQAERESGKLAEPLAEVSQLVAWQEVTMRKNVPDATADAMQPSLTLSEDDGRRLMKNLRRGGAALRARLTPQCVDAFKAHDFLAGRGHEPFLTFQEQETSPHVLWDLMYEGGTVGDVNWESFWGFRVPIAHWVFSSRTARISLGRGLFGGIHEELPFAAREIDAVARRMERRDDFRSVSDYFKRFVRDRLMAANLTPVEADTWLAEHESDWLGQYLFAGVDKPVDRDQWKHDKIVEMLRSTDADFDLLHFACHSASSDAVASRAELLMMVGGEPLVLDVGAMMADLRIKITSASMPGPLVFLNACRSVQTAQPFQPPPFATSWINDRGALAVVSAVCPVPDFFAHAFALKYYDYLFGDAAATFGGTPVKGSLAGALLATRRYFMEVHKNPLGLAYILYASPGAYIATSGR
jgi:hypothetical protein